MFRRRASEGKHEATALDAGHGAGPARSGRPVSADRPAGTGRSGSSGSSGRPGKSGAGEPERAAAEPWGPPPAGLDVSAPHPARVWNYWLGGRDFFAADKAAGEEI